MIPTIPISSCRRSQSNTRELGGNSELAKIPRDTGMIVLLGAQFCRSRRGALGPSTLRQYYEASLALVSELEKAIR